MLSAVKRYQPTLVSQRETYQAACEILKFPECNTPRMLLGIGGIWIVISLHRSQQWGQTVSQEMIHGDDVIMQHKFLFRLQRQEDVVIYLLLAVLQLWKHRPASSYQQPQRSSLLTSGSSRWRRCSQEKITDMISVQSKCFSRAAQFCRTFSKC